MYATLDTRLEAPPFGNNAIHGENRPRKTRRKTIGRSIESSALCDSLTQPRRAFFVVTKPVTRLDTFAFEAGGTLTVSGGLTGVDPADPPQLLKFYLCTEREFTALPADSFSLELDCQRPEHTTRCTASEVLNHTSATQLEVAVTQRYRFLLVHCSESPGSLRLPVVAARVSYTGTLIMDEHFCSFLYHRLLSLPLKSFRALCGPTRSFSNWVQNLFSMHHPPMTLTPV